MGPNNNTFEILDHTADLGIAVTGEDLTNLFQNAAHAITRIMLDIKSERPGSPREVSVTREVSVKGTDLADLMVRWLGEILFLFEGDNLVVTRTKIRGITPNRLDAIIETIPFRSSLHELLTEIKAVTYHQIRVKQDKRGRWNARIIFDL